MPTRAEVLAELRAVASGQGDVAHRDQLREIGLQPRTILCWVSDELLTEVARGVYSLHGRVAPLGVRWAAHLSTGRDSAISDRSAVDALGWIGQPLRPVHDVTRRGSRPQAGVTVHETSSLHDADIVDLDGLPCTNAARTLVDVARWATATELDRMLDRAVHLRQFDAAAVDAVLGRRRLAPATRMIEAAIARLDDTSGNNRSELERLVIALVRDSHLPPAANNVWIGGFEVDVWWRGTRAIVEADGDRFHSSPAQIAADIAKRKALEAFGFRILRVSWAEANYDTDRTIERIDRFRLANQAPAVPGPPAFAA